MDVQERKQGWTAYEILDFYTKRYVVFFIQVFKSYVLMYSRRVLLFRLFLSLSSLLPLHHPFPHMSVFYSPSLPSFLILSPLLLRTFLPQLSKLLIPFSPLLKEKSSSHISYTSTETFFPPSRCFSFSIVPFKENGLSPSPIFLYSPLSPLLLPPQGRRPWPPRCPVMCPEIGGQFC